MTQAQFVGRLEDPRLVKGAGRYAADWSYPGQLHAVFLRANRAHAKIRSINVEAARNHPGVVAVLTYEDVTKAGFGPMAVNIPPKHRDGRPVWKPHSPVLAHGRVRYVGELVACVVAQTPETAMDALELIEVDYEDLPAVIDPVAALDSGAPIIHPEVAGNVALDWEIGDEARTREAFTNAKHIVTLRVHNNRVIAQPMEPRACLAIHDQVNDVTTLHCPSQGVHVQLGLLSAATRLPPEKLNIVVKDVGGGFGARSAAYPEYVNVVLAARLLKRPVKWLGTRSEVFLNDFHGRDCVQTGELALDENLKFLGMRFDFIQALGAYSGPNGAFPSTGSATNCLTGEYDVPTAYHRTRIAITNTAPTAAYRGSGRPLMSYIVERLVDQAAIELKIDPVELRRRNLVPNGKMPYKQVHGITYDCGDFRAVLERALKKADWDGFEKRLAESAKRGKLRGRGIATFIEASGGGRGGEDNVLVRFDADGKISLYAGAQAGGQSHETTFAQIVSEATGLPLERFVVRSGDGTRIAGSSAGGSRTMVGSGSMFHVAALKVVEKGKGLAVYALEAPEPDIEFNQGEYRIKGTDRGIGMSDLIERYRSHSPHPLTTTEKGYYGMTFPNSCHICEIEVDPETGAIEILKYSGVDDAGRVINHQVVEGQMHGGIMQGTGQVLLEHACYDRDTGQLMTGTFMDYAMPRASNRVPVELEDLPTYTKTNPLGVKGVGECGVTGALATVMNAVMDAMRRGGVTHFDMPCTPQRVWAALQAAKAGDPRALSIDKNRIMSNVPAISRRTAALGTENAFVVLAEVNELMRQGKDVISFCIGQPDFHTPKNVQDAAVRAIREGRHGYTPSAGINELREAAAKYMGAMRGLSISPDHVVVGAGAKPFIAYTILSTTDYGVGDEVIYPNPGFPIYESQIVAHGAVPVPLHLREARSFAFDPAELEAKITGRTRLLILNSPQNPTGGILTRKDLEAIAAILRRHPQVWVYADEIYSRLVYEGTFASIASLPGMFERTIISDGASKTWAMTGWRLGFASSPALAPQFVRWVTNTDSCASQITQWATVEAIQGPQDEAERMRASFLERRDLIVGLLNQVPGVSCRTPGGAFYAWPNVTEACHMVGAADSEEFRKRLLNDAGVAVLADIHFGARVPGEGQHIRFSYAASTQAIEQGVGRMAEFIRSNSRRVA